MSSLARRLDADELMDSTPQPAASLEGALRFLELTNRWFGGYRPLLRRFEAWSPRWDAGRPVKVLDIGTGGADIPMALVAWARRKRVPLEVTAVEVMPAIAEIARARTAGVPEITLVARDIRSLLNGPDEADSPPGARPTRFDYVMACLFLHHVPPSDTVGLVRRLAQIASRGVIISDLRRSWPALAAVTAASRLLGNPLVRHDGPLSVRRAFTVGDLRAIAAEAGLGWLRARREQWFRVSLAGERPDAR